MNVRFIIYLLATIILESTVERYKNIHSLAMKSAFKDTLYSSIILNIILLFDQ